jgi:hypothetical protein
MLVPSCTIKARFLKGLPVGTVFQDPNNRFNYEVIDDDEGRPDFFKKAPYPIRIVSTL